MLRSLMPRSLRRVATALVVALSSGAFMLPRGALAQQAPRDSVREPGSELTVILLTMGVGDEIWEQFGHDALWIHDANTGRDAVYNWGLFDFNQPHFIPRFLKGQMLYSMGAFGFDETLAEYRARDREVTEQVLDLTPAQRLELTRYVEWNALPENRDYHYDYFTDNCSTRVRDVIDRALGGQLKQAATRIQTDHSYRWHTLRLTSVGLPMATGIDVALGRPSDKKLTMWEAMFIPMQVRDFVRTVQVSDGHGGTHPLVKSEHLLLESQTHHEPANAPTLWPGLLAIGVVLAGLIVFFAQRGSRAGVITVGMVWSILAGLLGVILTLMWVWTQHIFTHRNENLLLFHPLWLALAVMLPVTLLRGRWRRATITLVDICAAAALVALVIHFVGISRQDNWALLCAAVPVPVALGWAMRRLASRT